MSRCSLAQLYDMAEQLLLKEKTWSDFHWLEDEDREQVKSLLSQGDGLLGERRFRTHWINPVLRPGNYFYLPNRPDTDLSAWINRAGFAPFPLERLVNESQSLRKRWFEALNRDLSMEEWGVVFHEMPKEAEEAFLGGLPDRLRGEVEFYRKRDEAPSPYDIQMVGAKYSLGTVEFLSEVSDISSDLSRFLEKYTLDLHEGMRTYCRNLPAKMEILERVKGFEPSQWRRLAGLLPRRDLARLDEFLPKDVVRHLTQPLPDGQKKEVEEGIRAFQRELSLGFSGYKKVIQAAKTLGYLVSRILVEEKDCGEGEG